MNITSTNNEKIKKLLKLFEKKYQQEEHLFIVEGYHLIEEAYKSGYLVEIYYCEMDSNKYLFQVPSYEVSKDVYQKITRLTNSSQPIGICKTLNNNTIIGKKILLLDNVQDPGNLGTIIRSAKAFNIDTVVLGDGCVSIYNNKVIRATQGIVFHINIVTGNLDDAINYCKKNNIKIYGTTLTSGAKEISSLTFNKSYAIIMGNEGQGVNKEILEMCDEKIYINTNNKVESLNVAVATSIILYYFNK